MQKFISKLNVVSDCNHKINNIGKFFLMGGIDALLLHLNVFNC